MMRALFSLRLIGAASLLTALSPSPAIAPQWHAHPPGARTLNKNNPCWTAMNTFQNTSRDGRLIPIERVTPLPKNEAMVRVKNMDGDVLRLGRFSLAQHWFWHQFQPTNPRGKTMFSDSLRALPKHGNFVLRRAPIHQRKLASHLPKAGFLVVRAWDEDERPHGAAEQDFSLWLPDYPAKGECGTVGVAQEIYHLIGNAPLAKPDR